MTRRCATCGVGTVTGDDVRECDGCAFRFCNEHAATVDGVTKCHDCKEDDMRSAPLHDGTADCDDGVAPEARGAATRMGGLFVVVGLFTLFLVTAGLIGFVVKAVAS